MGLIDKDVFVCLDCETTGLDAGQDRIIEIAAVKFTFTTILETYETLVNPGCLIPESSQEIHHISNEMVQNKPNIKDVLPHIFKLADRYLLIGHGIGLDIAFIDAESKKSNIPCPIANAPFIDTLRMARLYGESPVNSLEMLRQHFNIAAEGAHRAMSDVVVNIEVFKFLAERFKTTEELLRTLEKPILLKTMPLGKHKGRSFAEIPIEYLQWAANKDFDQDLLFSIRSELKKRKKGTQFRQAINPFSSLNLNQD